MEIPGLSPLSNQSTVTNPLNQRETLQGQQTQAQSASETSSTTLSSEQETTGLSDTEVVNESNEARETTTNNNGNANLDATIDITV